MDGSWSLNPVMELRNSFEGLPAVLRRPIEMVVFGGELPRADISGMRRMAAEFRAQAAALSGHSEDAKDLLAQEDSVGTVGDRLRETLGLHRDGAARLGDDALALADQAQAAANDAEKTLCVMFVFGIELAWRIFGVLSGAAAAGPAGEVAAAPVVESMLVEGRVRVAAMRAGLEQAFKAGATRTAARLSALGSLRLPVTLGKAAALPVGVDAGVQALQVVSGDRTLAVIGPDGGNPTGIDLTSIKVAALSGAGGAAGGMVAGRVAPKVFPRIEGSRLALGLVHGTAGAVAGLGAATLVTGWPEDFDHVLAPLLNGGFAGAVHAHAAARPGSGAPAGAVPDGGGAFTRPDLPAARSEDTAAPTPALPPVEVSAESQQAWAAAKAVWAAAPDTVAAGGERAEVPAVGAHGNTAPVKSGESSRSPAVSGSTPHNDATGRAPVGFGSAAGSVGRSEAGAQVAGSQRGEPVARTNATAPRPVEAGGETSAPPKVATSTPARQVGTGPETPAAGEHRSPGNYEHGDTGKVSAAADEIRHETPVDARPATGTGDGPETPAAGEHRLAGNEEHAPAGNEEHAAGPERSALADETGDEVSAGPAADSVESAGSPALSARDQAVELLADFHAGSGDQVPEQLRLRNLPDEVLKAGLFDTDAQKSMIATTEIIRRGTISDAVPGGMVLRVEQAEGVYALNTRPVEMKPGEGKSLMFMAAAMQRAVRHGECLLVTTTDGLAHREFTRYRQLLTDFGIDVFRADQQQGFGPVTGGRPAVVVATGETVGHLCNAGHRPPRHALIDEMDGVIDRGERQFLRSEGVEQAAPEATAREVFAAHDFLADALEKGALSHEDFGLARIIEEVGLYADGTPDVEFWYDGRAELTPGGREKVEALPGGKQWLEGLGLSRLETAAAAEFTCRKSTHYVMDAGKIVIIDQGEHGLQRNPKTSSESRWSAEQGKASLAQAVEAKEIRSAEAITMSAEQHQIVVRADADSAKSINAVEIYRTGGRPEDRFFDEVTGASGTLADLNPVLEKIYGLEEAHQVDRSREQRLMEGAPEVVANTRAKLSAIAEGAHRVWQGGQGRSQEILCHRNDLVDRQVQALVRQGVPREAIEAVDADRIAGWGAGWEGELQKIFDAAGEQGKVLVINRQGQRGVDISVSEAVQAKGGMFVWMTEVPEQSYIHEQAKNRTARNGDRGAAQALISPQDALIRKAMHLNGVRAAAVHYEQVAEAHRTDPTPGNHNDLVEAGHNLRSLVPELQERALRHATADFIRHHAYITDNPAAVLAAAETFRYQGSTDIGQIGQPHHSPDQAARLAGLLGIPASAVAETAAALEQDGAVDPLGRLLEQTGLPPAAVEALRQHVEATAPATAAQYARLTDEQALDQLVPQRDRLAGKLGWDTEAIEGAEGMRMIDPALTEARNNLAKALGYPASDITPAIARDILGEAVNHHLLAEGADQPASRDDAAPVSVHPVSVNGVAENPAAEDVLAAASHYLATAALLDLVLQIHRRSPNSCVNNAVTGMRLLTARRFELLSNELAGHGRDVVEEVFGAQLEDAGSLDKVAESLKARPGGIAVLVYKWKDTQDKGSAAADNHMVLLVNDSKPGERPKLVVVDLATSRDGRTDTDYGPKDLQNRRTLLNKAVPFEIWRDEQQKFIDRLSPDRRRFETIDFDLDGHLVSRSHRDAPAAETGPLSQDVEVSAELVQEINSIQPGWPVNHHGTPDLASRTDADTPDKSDIFRSAEPARTGSRPQNTPDPTEPAPETGQEPETLSATPEALQMALAVVAASQCSPDIARDAQRFVMRCYEEYRQQQRVALQKRHRTTLVNQHGMPPEEAEQAAWEYVGSAEARPAIDNAAAQDVGGLILDIHRTADRAQISLPGSLADLSRAEANTANARGLQQAFALIGRDESSPVIAQDAKRFVMSCYEEYRQRQEAASRNERRTTLMNRHGMPPDEAEQAAREHVGSADVRAQIDSAAADSTRRLIHNIRAVRTKTSLPLLDILAHLHQAAATTANARTLAKSMKADTGNTRAPDTGNRASGDQVGSRPHEATAGSISSMSGEDELVGSTSTRDQQQHREPDGRIGGRPSENPGGRPDEWKREQGLPWDMASADWSADDLLSPVSRPLPAEVIGREIDEVTEILGSRVPPEQLADPEVRRGVRLAAEGLFINRRRYGDPDTGHPDDLHDAARHDATDELWKPGAANRHGDGTRVTEDLRRILDNGLVQGADLGEIMAALIADAWSDLAHGGRRHGGNPQSQDTVRSAELLHARALAHGCAASTARVLGFAVGGIGFDARTGTQTSASPAAVDELRQRWGEITVGEFGMAMRVARWVAAADLQALSEPDAVVQWVLSDWGNDVAERQALVDRLRDRAGFAHPDSGYRPPDGWLLANRDLRRDHAVRAREIADRLAIDPRYSPLDAYRDVRLHAAEMREEYSGFRWQLVVGPGADVSDPGTLADTVAARLPESGPARAREDIIDSVARLVELALPRAGDGAVFVVTSSQDADGRRRLLAQLDYTRPDATDPDPGVTAEELRRAMSDVDGRIEVDTAAPLPDGQVWHRVRLDLTRQRILVCCTYWGRAGSGMSTLNLALCQGLAEAGHEVIVWTVGIAQGSRISGVQVYGGRDSVPGPGGRKPYDGDADDLPQSVDLVIVHAEDGGIRAALAAETRYPAAKLVSVHHLTPMLWETLRHSPERGRAKVAARIYLARRAHLVTGLGPVLATDAMSAAVMARHGSIHELQLGLEIAEQPPEPAPGDPAWILLFGRVDDQLKGAAETAEVVQRLRAQGRDVRLVVRGYPKRGVESARAALAELVGDPAAVEVRPYTSSRVKVRDDIRTATVVVMPSRAEGFGGVAAEAIEQGVPVAVPSSSGVGRFLAELADYRDLAERFNLVEQPLGAQVPIDNWVAGLGSVLDDLPGAWAAARGLQGLMRPFTRENSARMLVHAARNTDPHARPAIPPSRTRVSLEAGQVVARGEEEDYLRILAVAEAMESDGAVREAVISGARIEFAVSLDPLTTGTESADDSGLGARSRAVDGDRSDHRPAPDRNGGPDGLIGSRPFEDSPGERAFAGPGFEKLVLAGLKSGIAERFMVEAAPGVKVEEVTFDNGLRVFMETYADPIDALVQVLQTEVAAIMGAPVAHAMLNVEDDRIYRELTPGRPGDSVEVVDPEVLASSSATMLGLFDAVTRTHRTAREWSVADNEVMGGRSRSDVDATPAGVFASSFVWRVDGREVWLDHAMPTWDVAAIREPVSYLEAWISKVQMPEEHRAVLLDVHGRYVAALAQVERHAVLTSGEIAHRAGLDVEARAKARMVEAFNLKYPHVAMVGFDHPDVPAHVVEQILGGLDEMFTRFPGRTNIRELWIDYTDSEATSARTHRYADPAAAGLPLSMQFSLRDAARSAQAVKRGIRLLELGLNPVGDRPFHHDAVHEFVHAIDNMEGLSKNLQQVLSQTHSQLSRLGLIDEHWWTWFARLPRYAFGKAKTALDDYEALAVGFAEADIHGAAAGSPQWAIHEYVTTGRPPQITPDLDVDLPAHEDRPDSGGPGGLIGSRPGAEPGQQLDAARGAWIKALRLERGMTRKQLTQAAGLANSALSTIESGQRKPRIGAFQRICRALGLEGEALTDAVRRFYSDVVLDTGVAAHDSLGDWLRAVRHSKGMTQSDLAHAVGVDPVRIRVYENNGESPRPGLFLRITRVLGVEQQALAEAAHHFYRGLELDLDPAAHDPRLPGSWIAALRYDRDMSQAELERAAGISETLASRIEGGHTPNSYVFWRICRALGVEPEVLAAAARHFYSDINLDPDPAAHDPASPGSWFMALRHHRGMNQSEVAKAIGSGSGHLSRIESGRNRPRFAVFRRICDALGVGDEPLHAAARHFYSDINLDIEPAAHDPGLPGSWIAALRNNAGMSGGELARRARMPQDSMSQIENQRFRPRLRKFRQLCGALGVSGEVLLEAVERFYDGDRFGRSGDRYEVDLFNRYVVSRVGSPEEGEVRDEICKRFVWVRNALALRESPDTRDEAGQAAWMGILSAIDNHLPSASFAPHAWASGSRAISRYHAKHQFPDLNNRTLRKVNAVRAQMGRMVAAGEALDNTEIARATRLKMADVMLAREILTLPTVHLDAAIGGTDRSHREVVDPAASAGSSDTDFAMMVRAALADMADSDAAERLVMLHLVKGMPLADAAERVALPVATAVEDFADAVARLRDTFGSDRPGEVTASERSPAAFTPGAEVAEQDQLPVRSSDPEAGDGEQDPAPLTPWTTPRSEPDQPPARSSDSEPGQGNPTPGGSIGSRPHEPGEIPRSPTPGGTTPWSREAIDEPLPEHPLRKQPSHTIPELPADNTPGPVLLTACETEVLARVRQGMTHNEIAAALDLSVRDVRAHLASIRRKLRNQRARLVAASRPADPPSTTSESDPFRAAMYAALTGAAQPDPRELLAAASPEQMERAAQGLSPAHRGALRQVRAGANTPIIRSMALIAARRWVTALAAEHDRSRAVSATALAAASPADLHTALDQLTAAERQLLVNRFAPATSPATFEPDDSVRALRAVDIVRHVAGRIATSAGMPAVAENGIDESGFQRGHHLMENETYTADECLDAIVDWMDRQDPPESGERSTGSRRGSSPATADRPDGRLHKDELPADEPGGGGPIAPAGAHPATASSEEPGHPADNNGTGSVHDDSGDRWRSLPVDHGFDDDQQRLADEALHAGGFGDEDMLQRSGDRLFPDSAQRRATENGEWWNSLSDPAEPGALSALQQALIQVCPHQIGNADGLPATIRDHANRLSISRDLGEFIARKPADQRLLNWSRTDLTDAERKQFGNLIRTRNHLQELDRQAAEVPGSPPVHLLSYDSTAFNGKGKAVVALGNVDTAHTVNWHVPGTNTTSSSLAYQFKPLRNLYEETLRVDPSLELASIIWIGYDAPAGPVNTGYAKAAFRRRARVGGRRLLCDIAAFHATRSLARNAAPDQLAIRIYGHSYGSVTMFYAGRDGGFAGLVRSAIASGSPGAASVRHAGELGIGADNVYVAASWRDLVTMFGADEPGARSRFNPRLGLGIDPATEAFGGKRIGAEFPDSPNFAGVEAVHQGYLHRDPATGLPTEALANVAQITAGRGDTLPSVDRRRAGGGVVSRPIDSERGRYADGNRDIDSRERAERVLREHWGPEAKPADLVYRWQRRSAAKHAVAGEACAAHAAQNVRIARRLGVDDLEALVRVWPEFVGKAGGFPRDVRDQANRRAFAKVRAALEDAAATTMPTRRERRLREYLLHVENLLIRAGHLAAAVQTPGVPAPTVLLESFDADDPSGGSIIISFGSGDPVAEAWHVDGSDRDLRRLDQRMQLACNHYEVAVRENPERSVRVVVWSGTDGHRLAGDMAALSGDVITGARLRPERQLVVHGEGGRSAKKALAHESVMRTVGTVVVCGESNLETMGDVLWDVAASVDVYFGVAARTNSPARSMDLPGVQFSCRFPSGGAGHTVALLTQARAVAQRVERAPFAAGKTIDDEFLLYVDDRVKASTDSLDNMGRILAGRSDRLVTHDDSNNEPVRFADYIRRERTESAYDDALPHDPTSGKPALRVTDADHVLARTAIDKRGDRGTEPSDLWHRGLPDDFTRAARLAADNGRWWNRLSSDERRAVVAVHPKILGNAPGIPSEVADYANDRWRFTTSSAIHAKGSKNASRSERQILRNLYAVDEALTRSVTVHRDIPAPIVSTVGLDPETFGGNGSGTFVLGNCRLEDAEHVVWYVDGVNTRLQSAPSRVENARNLYEELVRADRSRKVAVVCWMGYEAPANSKEAWAARHELAEAGGRLFARDVLALRAVSKAKFSVLTSGYGTSTVCDAAVGGRLDGVFEHRVLVGSPGRGRRFDSIADASCRHSWVLALSGDPVTGFGADAPNDGHGEYLDYALGSAAQPSESLRSAAWCLAGRGGELPREPHRPSVDNPTVLHRIRARVVDPVRDRRAPQLDAALAGLGAHRSLQDPAEKAVTDPVGAGRSRPAEPVATAAQPSPTAGPRIAVQLGAEGLADSGSVCTDALALGVNAIVVRVGRGAEDVAALDAVCRSAVFEDATLAVEVNAGPRWSDEEVRTKAAEVVATFARHGIRGELHAFDQRVLTAAAELAPDCHRVTLINSLTTATSGVRGALGWVARAARPGGEGMDTLLEEARRTGATGLAVPAPLLSEDFVRLAREAGMRLAVWGVAGSGRMRAVLGLGVDEIWTANAEKLALLRAEVAEGGFRIPEPFARSTPFSDQPPKATPWSQPPDRPSRDR